MAVKIPAGLRGNIYQTGKNSYRLQLSLGRNADGGYDNKRETVRGTEQDAIDTLIRWNVQYLLPQCGRKLVSPLKNLKNPALLAGCFSVHSVRFMSHLALFWP